LGTARLAQLAVGRAHLAAPTGRQLRLTPGAWARLFFLELTPALARAARGPLLALVTFLEEPGRFRFAFRPLHPWPARGPAYSIGKGRAARPPAAVFPPEAPLSGRPPTKE